jgi:hypothetical protein
MSRGSHAPTREIGKSGHRAKGGRGNRSELSKVARPRNASVLAYSQGYDLRSLESRVRRNAPARFGKGATEKVREEPRWCPTSFGGERLVSLSNQDPASYPTVNVVNCEQAKGADRLEPK